MKAARVHAVTKSRLPFDKKKKKKKRKGKKKLIIRRKKSKAFTRKSKCHDCVL